METTVTYKPITKKGKDKGWEKIKIKTVKLNNSEYTEYYYVSDSTHYVEHLYKTVHKK